MADASKAAAPTQPVLTNATSRNASSAAKSLAITFPVKGANAQNAIRGLVPNDMATMYGIRTLRNNGVTGKGITIALVEDNSMVPADWSNFASVFNLTRYGGTFSQINPAPASGATNCYDPNAVYGAGQDFDETLLDAEWSTAIAPAANIVVASCADYYYDDGNPVLASANFFGGAFIAATNVVNAASGRPDIISASYGYGEYFTDSASKAAIDLLWAQADAEGISVFVSSGDSGSNPSFNNSIINGSNGGGGLDANAFATSPNVTAVGGTDLADILDGTTSQYFASTPSVVGGSALSYVPEIPWNESCGNGLGAKSLGYASPLAFCEAVVSYATNPPATPTILAPYQTTFDESEAGSGGPSSVDRKPVWQRQIYNAASDQSRDLPDVSLFAGSFGEDTLVILCTSAYPCAADFSTPMSLAGGTSLASPMFAGIQALIDQGLTKNGLSKDQGNAAPTLYALAAGEYGGPSSVNQAGLSTCNADNGATGTSGCVFHNVTRGSNSTGCWSQSATTGTVFLSFTTPNCYYYVSGIVAATATDSSGTVVDEALSSYGLTTTDAAPTGYGPANKAFGARPGWSFATGLGSVNATNLLIAWRAFVNAPAIH